MSKPRVPFDQDDDRLLMKYIATYNPEKKNRMGNALYRQLVENAEKKWPWSKRHSWQSWRERYKDNQAKFDADIKRYQKKKGIRTDVQSFSIRGLNPGANLRDEVPEGQAQAGSSNLNGTKDKPALSFIQTSSAGQGTVPKPSEEENPAETEKAEMEQSENAAGDRRRSLGSVIPKSVARRPARKTAMAPEPREETGEGNDEEVSETEATESGEGGGGTIDGKRKAGESSVTGQAKRRRIENGIDEPNESRPLDSTVGTAAQVPLSGGPTSPSRVLEILSSSVKNGAVLDKDKLLELLLTVLHPKEEEKQRVIELAKAVLSVASPPQNEGNVERIYPRLEDDDCNPVAGAEVGSAIPGSWNAAKEPVTVTSKRTPPTASGIMVDGLPTMSFDGMQAGDEYGVSTSNNNPPTQSRQRASSKIVEEDFFKTPTPSPSPAKVNEVQPVSVPPESSPQTKQTGTANGQLSQGVSRTKLPGRDPLRLASGTFRSTFVPSRKHALSRGQAPDVDTGSDTSDTEVIPNEDAAPPKSMNEPHVPAESWPPPRSKKVVEKEVPRARGGDSVRQSERLVTQEPSQVALTPKSATLPPKAISQSFEEMSQKLSPALVHPYAPRTPSELRAADAALQGRFGPTAKEWSLKPDGARKPTETNKAPPDAVVESKAFALNEAEKTRSARPKSQLVAEPGPLQLQGTVSRPLPVAKTNKTESIHAWRSEARLSVDGDEDVSTTSVSDPFLTSEHAKSLRQKEKGKETEQVAVNKDRWRIEAEARTARRKTFGGLSTSRPPEIDLRKRALRSSVASNPPLFRQTPSLSPSSRQAADENVEGLKMTRRASVAASIDLSQEFPSPEMNIPPKDAAFMFRVGAQVVIQSIARNHSVNEELVHAVYEKLLDLPATDRVVAKMRRSAEQTAEREIEREEKIKGRPSGATTPISQSSPSSNGQPVTDTDNRVRPKLQKRAVSISFVPDSRAQSGLNRRYSDLVVRQVQISPISEQTLLLRQRTASTSALSSPERHGPDVPIVPASRVRTQSESRRRRSELFITPADEDPTYVHLRSQYVPPSASRAARLMRHRARRSSGLASSPLNGFDESMQVDDDYDENEKEEEEVTLASTPARHFGDDDDDDDDEHPVENEPVVQSSPPRPTSVNLVPQKTTVRHITLERYSNFTNEQPWRSKEDSILLGGDEEAIEVIIEKRGKFAVRQRMADLAQ